MKKKNILIVLPLFAVTVLVLFLTMKKDIVTINKVNLNYNEISKEEQKFLYDNHSVLDIEKNVSQLNLLKTSLKGKEVFLTGEHHALNVNRKLQIQFIKYLNKEAGVRYILLENSYSFGEEINKYLNTGDEEVLKRLYEIGLWPSVVINEEELEFWRSVYKYNEKLKDKNKLEFVGIDLEKNVFYTFRYLISLLPDNEVPLEIRESISSLRKLEELVDIHKEWERKYPNTLDGRIVEQVYEVIKDLDSGMEDYKDIYKSYLSNSYFSFDYVVKNTIRTINYNEELNESKKEGINTIRDNILYDNFIKLYSRLPKGKYFGQFGAKHICQNNIYDSHIDLGEGYGIRLGGFLNRSDSPVKGKVLSVKYLYFNGMAYSYNFKEKVEMNTLSNTGKKILEPFVKSDVILFKLTGDNSPFENELIWFDKVGNIKPDGGVTTDYYQYIVLIKNAKPISLESVIE